MGARQWTKEEEGLLREVGTKYGADWDGWGELFPNRSREAVVRHCRDLGVDMPRKRRRYTKHMWTNKERVALIKCMQHMQEVTDHTTEECIRQFRWLKKKMERGEI